MESKPPSGTDAAVLQGPRRYSRTGLIRAALGLLLLGLLIWYGQIDLRAVGELVNAPGAILTCVALVFISLPLAALRWGMLLRALDISIPFTKLFHIVSIATMLNVFLLGAFGGDAVRLLYTWREARHGRGRIAASILADRVIALVGLIALALLVTISNWSRMRLEPWLAALAAGVFLAFTASVVGCCMLFLAPAAVDRVQGALKQWPRLQALLVHLRSITLMLRGSPLALLSGLALSLLMPMLAVTGVLVLAHALGIGQLTFIDYAFAVPLTVLVNTVPISPNGLGVGEAAFDQICRWLEAAPSGVGYSSIFFAYRAVWMLTCLCGVVSYLSYRPGPVEEMPG